MERTADKRWDRKRALVVGICAAGVLAALFVLTEYVYYFPLTPLSLDTGGRVRLPPSPGKVRVLFVGDIMLADTAAGVIKEKGYRYIFGATRHLIAGADLSVGNLEGPIAAKARMNRRKRWSYKVPPGAARGLAGAGFDLMNLANNHIRDCGDLGISETLSHLKDAGVGFFGAGMDGAQAHRPAMRRVGGVSIAFLGYVPPHMRYKGKKVSLRGLTWGRGRAGAAWGDPRLIARDIADARKAGADLVLVSLHPGDRYQTVPEFFERDLVHQVIDAGADAVIGHGTHTMGPVEVYRDRPIVYSVGNFAFGSANVRARFSLMAFVEIEKLSKRISGVTLLPIYTVNRNPWIDHQTKVLVGVQAERVLRRLTSLSHNYGGFLRIRKDPLRAHLATKTGKTGEDQ